MNISKLILISFCVLSSKCYSKLSSTVVKKQLISLNNVIETCNIEESSILTSIKAKSIGTVVSSSIATVASGTATVTSGLAIAKSNKVNKKTQEGVFKESDDSENSEKVTYDVSKENTDLKNLRLASTIASGVSAGANLTSLVLSGESVKQLTTFLSSVDVCAISVNSVVLE